MRRQRRTLEGPRARTGLAGGGKEGGADARVEVLSPKLV